MTMKQPQMCLSPESLGQLARDKLTPAELHDIEQHVNECQQCRELLEVADSDPQWQEEIYRILKSPNELPPLNNDHDESRHEAESLASVMRLLGPTDDPHMLGRIGSYEVVGVIGRGGMGVVFKAFDAPLNRFVAIKMLLPHLAMSGAARKRFAREGQAAAAVIDDNVMPIYSVAEWQGAPYLVMQYSSGITLQKRLQQHGPLELKKILRVGMQTARGLAAAHAQGLVHRDVKPSNILLDGTVERAMLTDFGLARAVDDASITRTGIITGTPQYMSPEQARGGSVDARSDLFGLGCVLYAMCTGRPPFRADSSYAILRLIIDDEPRSIREVNPDIPEWLCSIVVKLMSKQTGDRYQSAEEVSKLLEDCLAHVQQPATVPLPAMDFLLTSIRFNSLFFKGIIVMIALLVTSVLGLFLWQATDPSDLSGTWPADEAAATRHANAAAAAIAAAATDGEGGSASGPLLEFLIKYPKQREQTERELKALTAPQFEAAAKDRKLRFDKTTKEGNPRYYLLTGDGHTVIVMFRDGKWSGIQRIRGEHRPDPEKGSGKGGARNARQPIVLAYLRETPGWIVEMQRISSSPLGRGPG